jgi:hypothetical protein
VKALSNQGSVSMDAMSVVQLQVQSVCMENYMFSSLAANVCHSLFSAVEHCIAGICVPVCYEFRLRERICDSTK